MNINKHKQSDATLRQGLFHLIKIITNRFKIGNRTPIPIQFQGAPSAQLLNLLFNTTLEENAELPTHWKLSPFTAEIHEDIANYYSLLLLCGFYQLDMNLPKLSKYTFEEDYPKRAPGTPFGDWSEQINVIEGSKYITSIKQFIETMFLSSQEKGAKFFDNRLSERENELFDPALYNELHNKPSSNDKLPPDVILYTFWKLHLDGVKIFDRKAKNILYNYCSRDMKTHNTIFSIWRWHHRKLQLRAQKEPFWEV
jgi:hypothetical protein